jgi:RNA polymerase sigma-70 factor (sigma-E family)
MKADFEEYVAARGSALLRTAYLLTGNTHDAEDLVQIALEKLVPKWASLRGNPDAYVRKVLHNEHINRWRRRRWREVLTSEHHEPSIEADTPDVDLQRALSALPPRQRAIVVLRYYEDQSIEQTAHVLGISAGTVKSTCNEALKRLNRDVSPREARVEANSL